MLVVALDEMKGPDQRWSFSTVGPMQEKKNLGVLNFLAVHQFETTARMSEVLLIGTGSSKKSPWSRVI
jgi:hypothetical protein